MTQILVACVRVSQLLLFHLLPLLAYYKVYDDIQFLIFFSFFSLLFSYSLFNIVVMCQQLCERVFQWNLFRNCNRILCTQNIAIIIFHHYYTYKCFFTIFRSKNSKWKHWKVFLFESHTSNSIQIEILRQ